MNTGNQSKLEASSTIDKCTICLEELHDSSELFVRKPETWNVNLGQVTTLTCNHKFHFPCIQRWFVSDHSHKCPICRQRSTLPFPPLGSKKTNWHYPIPVTDDWGTPPAGGPQARQYFRQNDTQNQLERKLKRDFWFAHYGHFLPNIP